MNHLGHELQAARAIGKRAARLASPQRFGGKWTDRKLESVRKYLSAYTTILSQHQLKYAYIDAFAGAGYRQQAEDSSNLSLQITDLAEDDAQEFLKGSARIALEVTPTFQKYIFIEKDIGNAEELRRLHRNQFGTRHVTVVTDDANTYIQALCKKDWRKHRAVMFLDPYGMQVTWETIEAIAGTQGIDLWILFPLGVAVNRMLTRSGEISEGWRRRLDAIFGTQDWYDQFYKTESAPDLFGQHTQTTKVATFEVIGKYFLQRLKTVFPGVAANPLTLTNSKNNPLYVLCFAAGNKKGAPTAVKIAQSILRS